VIARAGGVAGVRLRLPARRPAGGRWAGAIAAVSLLLADEFVRNFWRGNSEGPAGRVRAAGPSSATSTASAAHAFLLGFAACAAAPELWPFWGLYGLWLAWREPRWRAGVGRLRRRVPSLLWFLPEYVGLGQPPARRRARAAAQPGLGRVRAVAVRRGLPALVPDPDAAGPGRRGDRAGEGVARLAGRTRRDARLALFAVAPR
jgi:hypothetical protein